MKILITSGGTNESIDQVRAITNHSTGQLGKIIAETFLEANFPVTLVTTKHAVKPQPHPLLHIVEISNVESLQSSLEPLVKEHDVLIHSMAVSDYTPVYMTGLDEVEQTNKIRDLLTKSNTETKISSQNDYQVLFLKKTPKVISKVKEWNPAIQLIGFKLLVDVSKEELFAVTRESLAKNKADYIVANDLRDINSEGHKAFLVDKETEQLASTKEEIAQLLLKLVLEKR
ncbi:phosphopantothenate-cysteine ligase [Streptococcus gallinaceus]|uniref:phosphopantothenate--cysteine ligase n=1 Tax=Streptococcus gallinaceus TaxID=165758 RepID=UPI0020A2234E|nr:phosphopantothenate--cysteine ligase [Streptococcus gallinaceus]MCP1639382.1 phosphopantothenate-cysteine ligase [Streptococcus gallinaceus]MCP1769974.1 phosphopantothenate-cysteine ligase [Streptococcus gallinaceus]